MFVFVQHDEEMSDLYTKRMVESQQIQYHIEQISTRNFPMINIGILINALQQTALIHSFSCQIYLNSAESHHGIFSCESAVMVSLDTGIVLGIKQTILPLVLYSFFSTSDF